MTKCNNQFDVVVAGGGPAGSSTAIVLALAGAQVLLIEAGKFPRAKLCGEFISPECIAHFQRLGVLSRINGAGAASISRTVFYGSKGRHLEVPSHWFKFGSTALGLSRKEMDHKLLERAKEVGVTVLEDTHVSGVIQEQGAVHGIRVKTENGVSEYPASITIDATGRSRALARHVDPVVNSRKKIKRGLVAFKGHLENARVAGGACEIYLYEGGYGGLCEVEDGLSNLCFIVTADVVRSHQGNPEVVWREVVMKNSRAGYTMAHARAATPWLSVSLDGFGRHPLTPARGLLTIGDAASFIDPFTGSGMLMALESGRLAAEMISRHLSLSGKSGAFGLLASEYESEYSRRFHARLRISSLLRRAAFVPGLAEAAILLGSRSSRVLRYLACATRPRPKQSTAASGR